MQTRIAIIGSGSWATALSKLFLNNCESINWFIRNQADIDYFKEFTNNPKYLQSVEFEVSKISFYNSIKDCFKNSDIIVLAVPSAFLNDTFAGLTEEDFKDKRFFQQLKELCLNTI